MPFFFFFFFYAGYFSRRSRPREKDPPRQFSQTRRRALSRAHNSPLRLLHVLFMRIFSSPLPLLSPARPSRRSAPNVFYAKRSHFRSAPRPGSRLSRSRNIHVNNFRRCGFFSFFFGGRRRRRARFSLRRKLQLHCKNAHGMH